MSSSARSRSDVGLLDKIASLVEVFREIGLHPEQNVLVGQGFDVVGVEVEGALKLLKAEHDVLALFFVRQPEVTERLFPVIGADGIERLRVVRFKRGPLAEGLNRFLEFFVPVVKPSDLHVDGGVVGADVANSG